MNCQKNLYDKNNIRMNYLVFYPDDYTDLPLIVYLHGAGERGTDSSHLYRHAIPKLIAEGKDFPAIILCPQCPTWCVWDNIVTSVKEIIDTVVSEYSVKKDRICITGSSMGGFGTWIMGQTYPSFFAGMAPIAGGGMSWRSPKLKSTPVFAVHGTNDASVPLIYSKLMVDAVNKNSGNAKLLELEGLGHNDGIDYAYRNTPLIEWLLKQRRLDFDYVPEVCESLF